ncbi:MAG: hypothetical protein WC910_07285 [Bacteroidales bacterium]|jgi:hypothetical protein
MDEIKSEFQESKRNSEVMVSFGARLYNQFTANEGFRYAKEQQWLEDLRAYKGLYDPDVVISKNASKVYPKLTRSKVNIVLSRLHEMLFPENDKNFEIKPTPEPKIAPEIAKKIIDGLLQQKLMETQMAMQQKQTGTMPGQPIPVTPLTPEDVRLAIKAFTDATCENMSRVIDDQLFEMDYPEETKKVLKSGLLYGTGIMKGPMINKRTKHKWQPNMAGDYVEASESEDVPFFEAIRIWDWYPDMTITELSMIEGSFERHLMSKHDIRELIDREDYYGDIIKKFLTEHPNGNYVPKNWEIQLQIIEMEAGARYTATTTSYVNTQDTSRATNRQIGKKYEVLEYWGYIDGSDLEACGVEVPDPTLEYAANVWMIGKTIIKATLFEGALNRYKIFYYEKDETSLYGEGLARVMRHSQIAVASSARMILDNGACVSGDTIVFRNHHSLDRPSEITVRQLWETKHKHNSGLRRMKLRSVDESTGEIIYNRIADVFNNGIKSVFEVVTAHGYRIKATDDHRFMSDDGEWSELNKFCIGDNIAVNGRSNPLPKVCIECGDPIVKDGALRCRKCASKKENNPWNLKQATEAENNYNALENTARQRWACQRDKKDYCEKCGKDKDLVRLCIHHKDGNPYNNSPENKITCCQPCHMSIHRRHDYFGQPKQHVYVDYDEIVSIEFIGDEEVFDIELESPNHNFIANGFVVHNCVSGPQVEVNWSLLTPGQDMSSFYPRKIWYREGRGVEAQYPAIRNLSFESHIPELISISKFFMEFADIETTLPTWLAGQMVNNETAQAASGRMATITISIKDIVKNFDMFTEHIIQDLYAWNMEFNPRPDIKGDYSVKPRGVSSLIMKEIRMQAINQFMSTLTPEDLVYIPRRELLNERLKVHDININLKTEEEAQKLREEAANSVIAKLQQELMSSEVAKNKAQAMVNLTKAKERNIEANKAAETPPEIPENESPEMKAARLEQEQAKTDDQRTKTALMIDKHQAEMVKADHEMGISTAQTAIEERRKEEKHQTELGIKKATAAHGMKMKEKAANKPKTKPVKEGGK